MRASGLLSGSMEIHRLGVEISELAGRMDQTSSCIYATRIKKATLNWLWEHGWKRGIGSVFLHSLTGRNESMANSVTLDLPSAQLHMGTTSVERLLPKKGAATVGEFTITASFTHEGVPYDVRLSGKHGTIAMAAVPGPNTILSEEPPSI